MRAAELRAPELGRALLPLLGKPLPGHIAVACSGGADSLCLALLAAAWAAPRGIALSALIVDHGLRQDSAAEARQVAAWLRQAGIAAHILRWRGAKPKADIQAAAREARYRLLGDWCQARGVRHLLIAHHREDQAETLLLRAMRGSGIDGLAAMAPRRRLNGDVWLLRPLLDQPKARLVAALKARGQSWIEDPSNRNAAFARVRVREALQGLDSDGSLVRHLATTAANMARARQALEQAATDLLARHAAWHAAGFVWLDAAGLQAAPEEIGLRALARLLRLVGGLPEPPRLDSLQRLLADLGRPATLHRCRLLPQDGRNGQGRLLLHREARFLPEPMPLSRLKSVSLWDGRFILSVEKAMPGLSLAPLGHAVPPGLAEREAEIPRPVWPSLPALWRGKHCIGIPLLPATALPGGLILRFHGDS